MYRKLFPEEISALIAQGCRAENWDAIEVKEGFTASMIHNCTFCGRVSLGVDVCIRNVGVHISNYVIGDNVRILDCGVIETLGKSRFGNGVMVNAVNEGGGREVTIYNSLTSQIAYVMAMYRHRAGVIRELERLIGEHCDKMASGCGVIGDGAYLLGCGIIRDTCIGPRATLQGVTILSNVTVNSTADDPTFVGVSVKAYDSILSAGSRTDNGAIMKHCFVGEACQVDYNYTAEHSLFFANSHCSNGEACSIFAGPFTVSHHKSSLLIAGMFSFFNAGSGSNQSNHLFKMGAVHQGVHERGCKFGSDAYVMLPAREGPFTVILGRHKEHHDTEHFPFSYLVEDEGKSYLIPAVNLRSYGTVRDLAKWPRRNNRNKANLDIINFEEYNPFIAGRIRKAVEVSEKLLSKDGIDVYTYQRVRVKQVMVRRGLVLYRLALSAALGRMLSMKGESATDTGDGVWVDLSGMYAPKSVIENFLDDIEAGAFSSISDVAAEIVVINSRYADYARNWALSTLSSVLGRKPSSLDIAKAIEQGEQDAARLKQMAEEDALKDRDEAMATGYGIDATTALEVSDDFRAVRG